MEGFVQPSHEDVQAYYSQTIKCKEDLKTDTCQLGPSSLPKTVKQAISNVHDEILSKYYGCGLPVPVALEGAEVLDLGCGTGRDVYILSQLVGPNGKAVGVDMTPEQLAVANKYVTYHMEKFFGEGTSTVNVDFKQGFIERLEDLGMPGAFDLIISNCVVNLAMDKRAVLAGAKAVLKEGGEVYFSDIYASAPVPPALQANKELWGECLSGALFWKDLHTLCGELGLSQPILFDCKPVSVDNKALEKEIDESLKDLKFSSVTYRFFKKPAAETNGVANVKAYTATYNGAIPDSEAAFKLGEGLVFPAKEAVNVAPEVAEVLKTSRYTKFFEIAQGGSEEGALSLPILDPFVLGTTDKPKAGGGCGPAKKGCC